ncbi:MAG: hemerythrin domain-containing protein [Betaproteobacteria bacterium]|nr:hemerythrin domain-containing protein [Betaproteobacteria bacterium]
MVATTRGTASHSSNRAKADSRAKTDDAITLLTADHDKVKKLFKSFESSGSNADKKEALAAEICTELTVHATIEEEIFYPAAREALEEQDLLDEAEVEHATAKDLIAQLEDMTPGDELYDAKVTVLGEYIDHHVKEEQEELFPKMRKAKLDLNALGAQMKARKEELMAEMSEVA